MKVQSTKEYDVIVVGAGHNGLTAAGYLAWAGLSVLVLERRDIIGGCCVTEEISPGCRASTTSYIASMLRPEVIRDLKLVQHGLRMIPCDPLLLVPIPGAPPAVWWSDQERTIAGIRRFSARDATAFARVSERLKRLARYLQPFFLEPPPDVGGEGLEGLFELLRVAGRFRKISREEIAELVAFMTGSLGEFLDRNFERDEVKTLILANNVYGKHGGPYQPGSALGLLFHLLSGGDSQIQGFSGHVIGGMGAITAALAAAARQFGAEIRTSSPVIRIETRSGRVRGVVLSDGTEISSKTVLSNADPKRTFLDLVQDSDLPREFVRAVRGIKMAGPCAKVNLVLAEEPWVLGMPVMFGPSQRALFTLVGSMEQAERSYDSTKFGDLDDDLWIDCVVASNVDLTLAPEGRHVMTCFVQYVPYQLRRGSWDQHRDLLGDQVIKKISEYAPNVRGAIVSRQVLTPLDLERTYGLTEGNIFHGDLALEQLFFMRPVPGWAKYRTPVDGLYLCGAGAHPGGGVTGAPGHNAAHQLLRDRRRRRL